MSLPQEYVLNKIIQGGRVAEKLGAKILGLGAGTKVVGMPVSQLPAAEHPGYDREQLYRCHGHRSNPEAARGLRHDLKDASLVIIGATGSIGRVCALMRPEARAG